MPNFTWPTMLTQAGQPHDDENLSNVCPLNDSVYLAALRRTAPAAAISAVGFTVVIYLIVENILKLKPPEDRKLKP